MIYVGGDCHLTSCVPADWEYDATLIFVGQNSGEGSDRGDIDYPQEVKDMVSDFTTVGRNKGTPTIVVVSAPGMTLLPWSNFVDA